MSCTKLLPFPIDMSELLTQLSSTLDEAGVPYKAPSDESPALYHPTIIVQYALAHWNAYLMNGHEKHKEAFMAQVSWLVAHELRFTSDASGWPVPFASNEYYAPRPYLSASTQGLAISVLVHAYHFTQKD